VNQTKGKNNLGVTDYRTGRPGETPLRTFSPKKRKKRGGKERKNNPDGPKGWKADPTAHRKTPESDLGKG